MAKEKKEKVEKVEKKPAEKKVAAEKEVVIPARLFEQYHKTIVPRSEERRVGKECRL